MDENLDVGLEMDSETTMDAKRKSGTDLEINIADN